MKQIYKLLFSLLALLVTPLVLADAGDGLGCCGMGNMMYGDYGAWPMAFGWIFSLLIFVVLILLIIWLVKQIQKK